MKVSGFTFLRNAVSLGYPFVQSIQSLLPLVDEFIINMGESNDETKEKIQQIDNPKIKIMYSTWNDRMQTDGFVYGQQKMMAQYACTGDWAFYLEADELVHEQDYDQIFRALHQYQHDPKVEALVFDYYHFYGNACTYINTPAFYRRAARVIKTSVRSYAPDGLYWVVLEGNKKNRYPRAALANASIYHYGWVRREEQMIEKLTQVEQYWNKHDQAKGFAYAKVDHTTLVPFTGSHPRALDHFFPLQQPIFCADPHHRLTPRQRKHRIVRRWEQWWKIDCSKKHFTLV